MTLTNREISENYRDSKFHLMLSDFTGAFACWVTRQDGLRNEESKKLINEAICAYEEYLKQKYFKMTKGVVSFDYEKLQKVLDEDIFIAIPEVYALNQTKGDFIDLCALSRNMFFQIAREQITQPL